MNSLKCSSCSIGAALLGSLDKNSQSVKENEAGSTDATASDSLVACLKNCDVVEGALLTDSLSCELKCVADNTGIGFDDGLSSSDPQ